MSFVFPRYEFMPGPDGGQMVPDDQGDWVSNDDVAEYHRVMDALFLCPETGNRLVVTSDLTTNADGTICRFEVSPAGIRKGPTWEISVRMKEV